MHSGMRELVAQSYALLLYVLFVRVKALEYKQRIVLII